MARFVAEFDPVSLSRVVWCFARCGYHAPQVEDAMAPSALLEHLRVSTAYSASHSGGARPAAALPCLPAC